jgi:hypothetical protein
MLFSNSSRNLIVYDLVTRIWYYGLPQNPMAHEGPNDRAPLVRGKQMNLLLPSTLLHSGSKFVTCVVDLSSWRAFKFRIGSIQVNHMLKDGLLRIFKVTFCIDLL